jgi:hypothetical protein
MEAGKPVASLTSGGPMNGVRTAAMDGIVKHGSWRIKFGVGSFLAASVLPFIAHTFRPNLKIEAFWSAHIEVTNYFAAGGILITASVFIIGFASIRMHADLDHVISRYETIADRMITTSRASTSFPRPSESFVLAEHFKQDNIVLTVGVMSLVIADLVLLALLQLAFEVKGNSTQSVTWTIWLLPGVAFASALLGLIDYSSIERDRYLAWSRSIPAIFWEMLTCVKEATPNSANVGSLEAWKSNVDRARRSAEKLLERLPDSPWAFAVIASCELAKTVLPPSEIDRIRRASEPPHGADELGSDIDGADTSALTEKEDFDAVATYAADRILSMLSPGLRPSRTEDAEVLEINPAVSAGLFNLKTAREVHPPVGLAGLSDQVDLALFMFAFQVRAGGLVPRGRRVAPAGSSAGRVLQIGTSNIADLDLLRESPENHIIKRERFLQREEEDSSLPTWGRVNAFVVLTDRDEEDMKFLGCLQDFMRQDGLKSALASGDGLQLHKPMRGIHVTTSS